MNKAKLWIRKGLYILLIFSGASLVANTWITRHHVTGAVPELPVDQTIYSRETSVVHDASDPALIYFYATWCNVCKLDMPALESIADHYPVIAVAMQSGDNTAVLQHRIEQDINLDIINDSQGELAQRFRVRAVPTAFIVNEGEIKFSTQGFSSWFGYWSRMLLATVF